MDDDDLGLRGAKRAIPDARVLDTFDRALLTAHGKALALVAAYLQRAGIVKVPEFGRTLGILAVAAADEGEAEGDILGVWAGIILDSAEQ